MNVATSKPKTVMLTATKITTDGRRIELGTISYWSSNPLKRFWYWLTKKGL